MRHSFVRPQNIDITFLRNEIAHGTRYSDVLSLRHRPPREVNRLRVSKNIPRRARELSENAEEQKDRIDTSEFHSESKEASVP